LRRGTSVVTVEESCPAGGPVLRFAAQQVHHFLVLRVLLEITEVFFSKFSIFYLFAMGCSGRVWVFFILIFIYCYWLVRFRYKTLYNILRQRG